MGGATAKMASASTSSTPAGFSGIDTPPPATEVPLLGPLENVAPAQETRAGGREAVADSTIPALQVVQPPEQLDLVLSVEEIGVAVPERATLADGIPPVVAEQLQGSASPLSAPPSPVVAEQQEFRSPLLTHVLIEEVRRSPSAEQQPVPLAEEHFLPTGADELEVAADETRVLECSTLQAEDVSSLEKAGLPLSSALRAADAPEQPEAGLLLSAPVAVAASPPPPTLSQPPRQPLLRQPTPVSLIPSPSPLVSGRRARFTPDHPAGLTRIPRSAKAETLRALALDDADGSLRAAMTAVGDAENAACIEEGVEADAAAAKEEEEAARAPAAAALVSAESSPRPGSRGSSIDFEERSLTGSELA